MSRRGDASLDLGPGDVAGGPRAIGVEHRGRAVDAELSRQLEVAIERSRAVGLAVQAAGVGVEHHRLPALRWIGGAEDRLGQLPALEGQQEGVDRDVLELGQLRLEPPAERAGGVAEGVERPRAAAVHDLQGVLQRQLRDVDRPVGAVGRIDGRAGGLCPREFRSGDVGSGLRVQQATHDEVPRVLRRHEGHVRPHPHLVDPGDLAGRDRREGGRRVRALEGGEQPGFVGRRAGHGGLHGQRQDGAGQEAFNLHRWSPSGSARRGPCGQAARWGRWTPCWRRSPRCARPWSGRHRSPGRRRLR